MRTLIASLFVVSLALVHFGCGGNGGGNNGTPDAGDLGDTSLGDTDDGDAADAVGEDASDTGRDDADAANDAGNDLGDAVDDTTEDSTMGDTGDDVADDTTTGDMSGDADSDADTNTEPVPIGVSAVSPAFEAAPNWNDYVETPNDLLDSTAPACQVEIDPAGYHQCRHGGEWRVAELSDVDSCEGVELRDTLDAFLWRCADTDDGVFAYSVRLNDDVRLLDLIDLTGDAPVFRPLAVEARLGDREGASAAEVWWSNPLELAADEALTLTNLDPTDEVGTIYIIDGERFSGSVTFADDGVGLVITDRVASFGTRHVRACMRTGRHYREALCRRGIERRGL